MTSENTNTAGSPVIPNGARTAAYDALLSAREGGYELSQASAQVLEAAAPLIVAAELRRLVGAKATDGLRWMDLLARADELDPGSPATTRED